MALTRYREVFFEVCERARRQLYSKFCAAWKAEDEGDHARSVFAQTPTDAIDYPIGRQRDSFFIIHSRPPSEAFHHRLALRGPFSLEGSMPRNSTGTMSVPNTFSPGQTANPAAVNENFTDAAAEITASLPRDGRVGMTGPLPLFGGSVSQPSVVFGSDTNTGFYGVSDGVIGFSANGVRIFQMNAQGVVLDNPATTTVRAHGTVTSGTENFNFNDSPIHSVTQNGNVTFAIANLPEGQDLQINLTYTSGTLSFSNVDRWVLGVDAPSTTFAGTGLNPSALGANSQYTMVFQAVNNRIVGFVARTL